MMQAIQPSSLPECALLSRYARQGAYTDCYRMDVRRTVSLAEYVQAFYTSPVFKLERGILALAASRPSTNQGAQALAVGQASRFAAWDVEDRDASQLLLRDFLGRTRSWLMAEPLGVDGQEGTRLYFGSAVTAKSQGADGKAKFGFAFHALHGFHHLYTKALMRAAMASLVPGGR